MYDDDGDLPACTKIYIALLAYIFIIIMLIIKKVVLLWIKD